MQFHPRCSNTMGTNKRHNTTMSLLDLFEYILILSRIELCIEDLLLHSFCSEVDARAVNVTSKGWFQWPNRFEDTFFSRSCAFLLSCCTCITRILTFGTFCSTLTFSLLVNNHVTFEFGLTVANYCVTVQIQAGWQNKLSIMLSRAKEALRQGIVTKSCKRNPNC